MLDYINRFSGNFLVDKDLKKYSIILSKIQRNQAWIKSCFKFGLFF